jgi:hypothetical protein
MGWFDITCVCGCDADDHMSDAGTPAGGPCANHWHCDYYDTGSPYPDPSEASTEGEAEYLANLPHRFW